MPFDLAKHHENLKEFNKALETKDLLRGYDLNENSTFFDVGAFNGEWSDIMYKTYGCFIEAYEPVTKLFEAAEKLLSNNGNAGKINVYNCGLGAWRRSHVITVDGEASSTLIDGLIQETIYIVSLKEVLKKHKSDIDLIKINIEGGEYELLDHMIAESLASRFKNIQIQFHANTNIKNYDERIAAIRAGLSKTHKTTYSYDYIWENWERL
jgi:FkbM family methyltransferase